MFASLFGKSKAHRQIEPRFQSVVTRARDAELFANAGVPDTIEGRFELLVLMVWQEIHNLNMDNQKDVAQAIFDRTVDELEGTLREQGFNDKGFAKRMKKLVATLYSRFEDYEAALKTDDAVMAMVPILSQHVWQSDDHVDGARTLAQHVMDNIAPATANAGA